MRNRITMLFASACYLGVIGATSTSGSPPEAIEPPELSEPDDEEERQASDATGCTCADNNPCTFDECLACVFGFCAGGCLHTPVPNFTLCIDDSLFCNGVEYCISGICIHNGNPCLGPDGDANCAESCNEAADNCTALDPNGSPCDDADSCTEPDTCQAGICTSDNSIGCDDDDPCTQESCNPATGCVSSPVECGVGQECDPDTGMCVAVCQTDLSGDGTTNAADLALLLGAWGMNPGHQADFNNDGVVNASDLALLLGAWGACE